MSKTDQKKIIALQKALKIAKDALEKIGHGHYRGYPDGVALDALTEIQSVETQARPPQLQGLLGH